MTVPFHVLAATSRDVAALPSRSDKIERLAATLRSLPEEWAEVGVSYLSGVLPQGRIGVGYRTVQEAHPGDAATEPLLLLDEVDRAFGRIASASGPGSAAEKTRVLRELLARATPLEQDFLVRLVLGELRQGAQESVVLEAVSRAAGVSMEAMRRAVMLGGGAAGVAGRVLEEGEEALEDSAVRLFRPVKPMLAATADGVEDALARLDRDEGTILEHKYDGARLQVHREGGRIRVFTRRLNDETEALPEVVEAVRALPVASVVLDGEALALRPDGRPRPFQETMRRFGRVRRVEEVREAVPLTPFFFDVLHLDGTSLIDRPTRERLRALEDVVPPGARVPRIVTSDPGEGLAFLRSARQQGHEGLMAKDPAAPYRAGRRGSSWLKIKPTFTVDLVVLGAEWGSGRRRGWLSNLHLGALDAGSGEAPGFVMVGKTFKGMTDEMLRWQTGRLQELERERRRGLVLVRPELVVEVAFDGLQSSPRYPGGVALRFARVRGYRTDKTPADADTIQHLRDLHRSWGGS